MPSADGTHSLKFMAWSDTQPADDDMVNGGLMDPAASGADRGYRQRAPPPTRRYEQGAAGYGGGYAPPPPQVPQAGYARPPPQAGYARPPPGPQGGYAPPPPAGYGGYGQPPMGPDMGKAGGKVCPVQQLACEVMMLKRCIREIADMLQKHEERLQIVDARFDSMLPLLQNRGAPPQQQPAGYAPYVIPRC